MGFVCKSQSLWIATLLLFLALLSLVKSDSVKPLHGAGDVIISNYLNSLRRSYSLTKPGFTLAVHPTQTDEEALDFMAFSSPLDGMNPIVFAVTNDNILLANPPPSPTFLSIPLVAAAFVPIYNFPFPIELNLDAKSLDDIISGRVMKWNDPYLRSINPRINLPNERIVFYYPNSETTKQILYHNLVSYGIQTILETSVVAIPVPSTYDVLLSVAATPNSLGISDYATCIRNEWTQTASLVNRAKMSVQVSSQAISEAVKNGPTSIINFIDLSNLDGPNTWPWSFYSCVTVDTNANGSCDYRAQLLEFMTWALTNEGASSRASSFGFSPVAYELQSNIVASMQSFVCDSLPVNSGQATLIQAAGATFPAMLYTEAAYLYRFIDPKYLFSYKPVGSSDGINQIIAGKVDFAGTDSPIQGSQDLSTFPIVAGAVVVVYNIPGITSNKHLPRLVLSRSILADIYLGRILVWNDPAILKVNPSLADLLPPRRISVSFRSDGSGTTYIFSSALSRFSKEFEKSIGAGNIITPLVEDDYLKPGFGNSGVLAVVVSTDYSLGYVVLGNALESSLPFADVLNKQGRVVSANRRSIEAAMSANLDSPLVSDITDAPGEDSYPIVGYTYILVRNKTGTCEKIRPVLNFMNWILTSPVALETAGDMGFAVLPQSKYDQVTELMNKIECDGVPAIRKCQKGEVFDIQLKTCLACPSGHFSEGLDGPCRLCPAGSFSAERSSACQSCPKGYFSDAAGSNACTICPKSSTTFILGATSMNDCVCLNGTVAIYSKENNLFRQAFSCEIPKLDPRDQTCNGCQVGADGIVSPGCYFFEGQLLECRPPSICLGQNICEEGYGGVACQNCDANYMKMGDQCVICLQSSLAVAIVFYVLVILLGCICSKHNLWSILSTMNYVQIASVSHIIPIHWPKRFLSSLYLTSPSNILISLVGVKCADDVSYFTGLWTRIVLPLSVSLIILPFVMAASALRRSKKSPLPRNYNFFASATTSSGFMDHFIQQPLFAMCLYGFVFFGNEASIEYLKCIQRNGTSVMLVDSSVSCDENWSRLIPVSALGIFLHYFAVPLILILTGKRIGKMSASDSQLYENCNRPFNRYRNGFEWWEGFLAGCRSIVFCIIVLFAHDARICIVAATTFLILQITILVHIKPYQTATQNYLDLYLNACNILILYIILLLDGADEIEQKSTETFGLFVFLSGLLLAALVNLCEFLSVVFPSLSPFWKDPAHYILMMSKSKRLESFASPPDLRGHNVAWSKEGLTRIVPDDPSSQVPQQNIPMDQDS